MPWIESHTVLIRHRKLIELAKDLRLKPVYAMGHLHALWHAALEQQEDGDLSSWSDELIADLSCYAGDAPQYVSLLQEHKWLDGKLIHDWLEYAGNYLSRKYHNSNRRYLKTVWAKHGKHYGKSTSLRKQKGSPDPSNLLLSSNSPILKSEEGGSRGKPAAQPDGFAEFWSSYPKKNKKQQTVKEWLKVKPDGELLQTILNAIGQQKAWRECANGEFRPEWPDPERWIKHRRWDDEIPQANGIDHSPVKSLQQIWDESKARRAAEGKEKTC